MCLPSSGEAAPGSPLLQPLLGGGGGGSAPVTPRSGTVTSRGAPVHAVLAIGGMQCSCCAVAVERALRYVPSLVLPPCCCRPVAAALHACKLGAQHPPARLPCSSLPGVRSAGVFLLAETAHVELDPAAAADMRRVLDAVASVGFTADLLDTAGAGASPACCSMVVAMNGLVGRETPVHAAGCCGVYWCLAHACGWQCAGAYQHTCFGKETLPGPTAAAGYGACC